MNEPERIAAAQLALEGISLGDAFGQSFFSAPEPARQRLRQRRLPPGVWRWSDDTVMALSIVEVLEARRGIDQDLLAARFARRFAEAPERGYGAVASFLLSRMGQGEPWRAVTRSVYGGDGSMGNGAAMRVAPVGAYFSDDLQAAARQATLSAEVTHAHPEGQAGAVAVAVAAALIHHAFVRHKRLSFAELFDAVLRHTPEGATHKALREAARLQGAAFDAAARALGDGSEVISADTVPFSLFCAASCLGRFEDALFGAMEGLLEPSADRDTVCAIVGGLAALSVGLAALPVAWQAAREPLPP